MNLDRGQQITVVGRIDSVDTEEVQETSMGNSWKHTRYNGVLTNSYLVSDRYELSGTLVFYYKFVVDTINNNRRVYHTGEEDYWTFGLDLTDDNVIAVACDFSKAIPVEHVKGQDIETVTISGKELKNGDKITVSNVNIEERGQKPWLSSSLESELRGFWLSQNSASAARQKLFHGALRPSRFHALCHV